MCKSNFSNNVCRAAVRAVPVVSAVLLLTLAGCSSDETRAAVSGKVLLDGQPIKQGTISFIPVEKGPMTGSVIRDGSYSIPKHVGAFVGKNNVEIRAVEETGKQIKNPYGENMITEALQVIPERYNLKTELFANIEKGKSNVADFNLESNKDKAKK